MRARLMTMLAATLAIALSSLTIAQDRTESQVVTSARQAEVGGQSAESSPNSVSPGKPYRARISVDTPAPIVYGDDVVVSVWITPLEGFDLKELRIHPKGALASLYDQSGAAKQSGAQCRTSSAWAKRAGVEFSAVCRMESMSDGLGRVFNLAAVLPGGGVQQFEVELILFDGIREEVSYFEFGAIEFQSPMLSVIIGGVLGAGLWAFFLPVSSPFPSITSDTMKSWTEFRTWLWSALPQIAFRWMSFALVVLRSVLLGGVTALILIILAKTTEGFETPIALQVKDLWGGLLVGILSAPLAKWIRHKVETVIQHQG